MVLKTYRPGSKQRGWERHANLLYVGPVDLSSEKVCASDEG